MLGDDSHDVENGLEAFQFVWIYAFGVVPLAEEGILRREHFCVQVEVVTLQGSEEVVPGYRS